MTGGIDPAEQRAAVRERYATIATGDSEGCCDSGSSGSCSGSSEEASERLGYSSDEIGAVAGEANLGLGCGNPTAIADLRPGETVLDLGSGGGFDCFLAARRVGPEGRVIGVDMTPEMVEKARKNAEKNDAGTVSFRLGEIEHLPVADESVDAIVSNCVINLSADKPRVFAEAFRVLRPGGRLAVSDLVRTAEPLDGLRADPESVAACVAGAATIEGLEAMLAAAGFEDVGIDPKDDSEEFIREWSDERDPSEFVVSATIEARRP
ncbi:arsenite methyltransferase [Halalkalicoccus jeotgali]|uniref:Arsenite methyltransferase n=1 Tax=Halalkalicoccus jeotgali (strain DSM 18796 / CECT 7217 / JCM 14584 / KCTC 4019 / B3) TaxID=795797 RepID=D8JAM7_HALJB|nr:arsenite methyltransferase [Halalkalicoccus jeotgali]ADJ14749.1 Methyltransferase type 11 [Halalkalicoccus jeotgali B3]ELY39331.1 type 11 methyltransferase [Halalkalicoccus jeotgali B3]